MLKENTSSYVFEFLKSRFELGEAVDENGNSTTTPEDMRVFSFDFKNKKGEDLGCVVCSLVDDSESSNSLKIYFGDELANVDAEYQKEWLDFLKSIRQFAKIHMLGFDIRNINKSTITRRDVDPMFESSFGPIDGTVRTSRQPLENMQIIIKHTANVDPKIKNSRSRKIQKIYLANNQGEKFLLPFKSLMAARAMARHIYAGGTPYDAVGSDICSLVEEMVSLSKFVRKMKSNTYENPEAINAINSSIERIHDIKRQLSSLSSQGGYDKNKPSLTGNMGKLEEDEDMPDLFNNESLDDENKMALPHVMRAYRNRKTPTETGEFEQWANSVSTGEPEPGEEILTDEEQKICGTCPNTIEGNGFDDSGLCQDCYKYSRNQEESDRYWEHNNSLDESETWQDKLTQWVNSSLVDPKLEAIIKERVPTLYARLEDLRHGRAAEKITNNEKIRIEKALRAMSKLTEADMPSSAGSGSPLSYPNLKPMDDFHSPKEIKKLKNTIGKESPLSLISSKEKLEESELNDIIRLSGR